MSIFLLVFLFARLCLFVCTTFIFQTAVYRGDPTDKDVQIRSIVVRNSENVCGLNNIIILFGNVFDVFCFSHERVRDRLEKKGHDEGCVASRDPMVVVGDWWMWREAELRGSARLFQCHRHGISLSTP